jgi:hypothetical protein
MKIINVAEVFGCPTRRLDAGHFIRDYPGCSCCAGKPCVCGHTNEFHSLAGPCMTDECYCRVWKLAG